MQETYDVIVVGLGAIGSAATYHLAKRGLKILGLDMYQPGHSNGSSHGYHRMIRKSSFSDDGYVPLAERAFELWQQLEDEADTQLLHMLGEVRLTSLGEYPEGLDIARQMNDRGMWEILSASDLRDRFPGFQLHDDLIATFEAEAGYLRSEAGILAHLDIASQHGARFKHAEEIINWSVNGEAVSIKSTHQNTYTAEHIILTTGPWAGELLADLHLPLEVARTVNGYFQPANPGHWRANTGAPNFLLLVPEGDFYGMPELDEVGLKIGLSGGSDVTTARTIRRSIDDSEIDFLRDVLDRYMPGASGRELQRITCMCTYTPDKEFIVDRHPNHPNILFGCGFSGRGYKFAPTIGEILADLAVDGTTRHAIDFMSARRFSAGMAAS